MNLNPIEEGARLALNFSKIAQVAATGVQVVPVVLQNAENGEVLFIGYANDQALRETLRTREAVLWSTSRNELWHKGATSGDVLELVEIRVNCEQNSLLYRVRPRAGACHTRGPDGRTRAGCYYRRLEPDGHTLVG
jgi:phosphoribosyl-AMP cyclohydrolase